MSEDVAEADQRPASQVHGASDQGIHGWSGGSEPDIIVRKDWLPDQSTITVGRALFAAIVLLAIGQAVWAIV